MERLNVYGLGDPIQSYPEKCTPIFLGKYKEQTVPDANYLYSLMMSTYSSVASSRLVIEESIMDFLYDNHQVFEDKIISGNAARVACRYTDYAGADRGTEQDGKGDEESKEKEDEEIFEQAELTIPAGMGWLTGQRHKHIFEQDNLTINVCFDHECLSRNPKHQICFPVVTACCRQITILVSRMNTTGSFQYVFVFGYCNGQAFGSP